MVTLYVHIYIIYTLKCPDDLIIQYYLLFVCEKDLTRTMAITRCASKPPQLGQALDKILVKKIVLRA